MPSKKKGFTPKEERVRERQFARGMIRSKDLAGWALVGCERLKDLPSATETCEGASNYVRGVVSVALGSAATILNDLGDAIAPVSEDAQHDSRLVPGEDF